MKTKKSDLYRHEIENKLGKSEKLTSVLDILFGTYDNGYRSKYKITKRNADRPNHTFMNRLNLIWVVPTFIVLWPFRFMLFGRASFDEDSKVGKILQMLLGSLFK